MLYQGLRASYPLPLTLYQGMRASYPLLLTIDQITLYLFTHELVIMEELLSKFAMLAIHVDNCFCEDRVQYIIRYYNVRFGPGSIVLLLRRPRNLIGYLSCKKVHSLTWWPFSSRRLWHSTVRAPATTKLWPLTPLNNQEARTSAAVTLCPITLNHANVARCTWR